MSRNLDTRPTLPMRRPATVVRAGYLPPPLPVETYTAAWPDRVEIIRRVRRDVARGDVRPIDPRPWFDEENAEWCMRVKRVRPSPPSWHRPARAALGVLILGGGVLGLLGWFLAALSTASLALLCLGALAALTLAVRAGRGPSVHITQMQNVYVRR